MKVIAIWEGHSADYSRRGRKIGGRQIDKVACNNPLSNFTDTDKQCLNKLAIFHSEPSSNNWELCWTFDGAWVLKMAKSMLCCALCHTAEKKRMKICKIVWCTFVLPILTSTDMSSWLIAVTSVGMIISQGLPSIYSNALHYRLRPIESVQFRFDKGIGLTKCKISYFVGLINEKQVSTLAHFLYFSKPNWAP